jgi:hypothetical protein
MLVKIPAALSSVGEADMMQDDHESEEKSQVVHVKHAPGFPDLGTCIHCGTFRLNNIHDLPFFDKTFLLDRSSIKNEKGKVKQENRVKSKEAEGAYRKKGILTW